MSIHDFRAPARWPTSGCRSAPAATSHFSAGIIRHIIENNLFFRDYVVHFTNASCILREDFRDTDEGATGFFSGWNEEQRTYDKESWFYEGHPDLSFPERDLTLQHPRCVFQTLRRHFARYTPEMVEKICGISPALFHKVADALVSGIRSGQDSGDLLRARLDATFERRPDHSHRGDPAACC